jgi:hypothetical protein
MTNPDVMKKAEELEKDELWNELRIEAKVKERAEKLAREYVLTAAPGWDTEDTGHYDGFLAGYRAALQDKECNHRWITPEMSWTRCEFCGQEHTGPQGSKL